MIEIASVADAEAILLLQKEAFHSEGVLYNNPQIAPLIQTLDDLRAEFTRLTFLKYLRNGVLVGSVRAELRDDACHIGKLMVHPACQHQGIGRILLCAIERHFAPRCSRFCLFTGIRNPRNLRFYENAGYHVCGESSPYPGMTLIHFEKPLANPTGR